MKIKNSIITPVYNNCYLTLDFIKSLVPYLDKTESELIIVDNASTDQTSEALKIITSKNPRVGYIYSKTNLMFGGGNHLGVINSIGDNLLFISNDVQILDDPISPFINILDVTKTEIYGSRLINWNTGWNIFNELENPIHYLEGWYVAISRYKYNQLGGWDLNMKLDYEDIEISYRAKIKGYNLVEIPHLKVKHMGGMTASKLSEGRLKYTLESQKYFCDKYKLSIRK